MEKMQSLGKKRFFQRGYGRGIINLVIWTDGKKFYVKNKRIASGTFNDKLTNSEGYTEIKSLEKEIKDAFTEL